MDYDQWRKNEQKDILNQYGCYTNNWLICKCLRSTSSIANYNANPANHDIVCACWFIYKDDLYWKNWSWASVTLTGARKGS